MVPGLPETEITTEFAAVIGAEPGLVGAHETHFHGEDRVRQIAQHQRALVLENFPRRLSGEKILKLVKVRLEDMRIDPIRAIDPSFGGRREPGCSSVSR